MSSSAQTPLNQRMIPLGLFSIGFGLFVAGGQLYGAIPDPGVFVAFGLFTAALGALITGYWAFHADNIFGGVAMSTIGVVFAGSAVFNWFFVAGAKDPNLDYAWISAASAVLVGLLAILSFKAGIPRPGSVTLLLFFAFLAILWAGSAFQMPMLNKIGGVVAILTAIMAWIGGFSRLSMSL